MWIEVTFIEDNLSYDGVVNTIDIRAITIAPMRVDIMEANSMITFNNGDVKYVSQPWPVICRHLAAKPTRFEMDIDDILNYVTKKPRVRKVSFFTDEELRNRPVNENAPWMQKPESEE